MLKGSVVFWGVLSPSFVPCKCQLSLGLQGHAEMLAAPLANVAGLHGFERFDDRFLHLPADDRSKTEEHCRHPAFVVAALELLVFADQRLQHLAASQQPLVR